jgi:predicted RNA-binding protein YlxR (DUF448 family)
VTAGPTRRCAGCGRRAPQRELVRFVAADGELVAGPRAPGRGAYTCRNLSCFRRAARSKGFARALREPVHVGAALEGIYTGDVHG